MFKKLVQKLKLAGAESPFIPMSSPMKEDESLKKLSKHALSLYERQTDIKNFSKLVLSDPENNSHNEIVDALFKKEGISDPFSNEALFNLSENKRFLHDLGLD